MKLKNTGIMTNSPYGNIPEEVLHIELGQFYNEDLGFSRYTLQNELDTLDEEIIHAEWETGATEDASFPELVNFTAWTENFVAVLTENFCDEPTLIIIPRNPPN